MARHNKKRNVGLIYEQLISRLSRALVESDDSKVITVKTILQNKFSKNTHLHKEFRLFNALASTRGVSESLATRILGEAQKAAIAHDIEKLDNEKSSLIKEINHRINETDFYNQRVNDYTIYATIQQVLNGWRSKTPDIATLAKHEAKVHQWLCTEAEAHDIDSHKTEGINDLTVQVLESKFSKKFGRSLNENQRKLLGYYCDGNESALQEYITAISLQTKNAISKYSKNANDRFLLEKTKKVKAVIVENVTSTDINGVAKAMLMSQLLTELEGATNE
jgi:hypothetical protein